MLRRCTMNHERIKGKPSTANVATRPSPSSSPMVWREINARAIPAMTACFKVSLLLDVIAIRGERPAI